jgi:FixJ family two-component response regulator
MTYHIVEDDDGVSDTLLGLFEALGLNAVAHQDAESLLSGSVPDEKDTVIVDLSLPGISGVQLIRWLTRLREPPRIIAISGRSKPLVEAATRSLPIACVVSKPIRGEEFAQLL